jgi:hypothetical protein
MLVSAEYPQKRSSEALQYLQHTVAEEVAKQLRVDERLDLREEWVVAMHQVRDEQTPRLSRERDDLVGLLHRDRQGLLDVMCLPRRAARACSSCRNGGVAM